MGRQLNTNLEKVGDAIFQLKWILLTENTPLLHTKEEEYFLFSYSMSRAELFEGFFLPACCRSPLRSWLVEFGKKAVFCMPGIS
ncbi:hypothetical protein PP175_11670 [Aneurinibacillus sp. Ricciae_BoGa-3]|nr:hypothetical protein [Aneurinibacillus sp. Ricciae_BoGa-3]WCK56503.1 hypothetical protein PP175_11670 [Aneurinibacillus sp. Ricciae_BoGa-3]